MEIPLYCVFFSAVRSLTKLLQLQTEAAMEARHNAERLGVVEAQIASLTPKYEAAVEDARAMRVEAVKNTHDTRYKSSSSSQFLSILDNS